MMARLYFDKKSNFRGYSMNHQEFISLYFELAKLIFFLAIIAAGFWLAAEVFGGLTSYVIGYEKLAYPHKATGGFYYYLFSASWALISGPYSIGSAIAFSSITPWSNLNHVIGIFTGLTIYALLLATPVFLGRVVRLPSKSVVVLLILVPGIFSLIFFLITATINWLFSTNDGAQIPSSASAVMTSADKQPIAVPISTFSQPQPKHGREELGRKVGQEKREIEQEPNKKEIETAGELTGQRITSSHTPSHSQDDGSSDISTSEHAKPRMVPNIALQGERTVELDPRTRCAKKENFISRGLCESRACQKPEFSSHPYCGVIRHQSENQ